MESLELWRVESCGELRVGSCSVEVAGQARDEEWAVCVLTGLRAYEVGFNTNENEENYICGFDDGDGGVYSPWPPLQRGKRDDRTEYERGFSARK